MPEDELQQAIRENREFHAALAALPKDTPELTRRIYQRAVQASDAQIERQEVERANTFMLTLVLGVGLCIVAFLVLLFLLGLGEAPILEIFAGIGAYGAYRLYRG